MAEFAVPWKDKDAITDGSADPAMVAKLERKGVEVILA